MPHVHPLGQLELPTVVDALVEVLRTALNDGPRGVRWAYQLLEPLPDADGGVLGHLAFGAEASHGTELGYERVPFEVVPGRRRTTGGRSTTGCGTGSERCAEGFAGTALAAFREAYRRGWEDHLRGAEAMGRAYDALGRAPLVARVQRTWS